MNVNCVICSDIFDEAKAIAATPCGHVYHADCITTWLGKSKTCPQCRSRTFLKGIQRLYFNFHPNSRSNSPDLENEITRLTSELCAKDLELTASEQERDRLKDYVKNVDEQLQAVSRQQYENFELSQSFSALEARVFELEDINTTLANDLEQMNRVHTIVNGTQRDAEDILNEYNDHSNTARQLATYCACLKRELLDSVQSKRTLMDLTAQLRSENNLYATETRFYTDALGLSQNEVKETGIPSNSTFKPGENFFSSIPSTSRKSALSDVICLSPLSVAFNNNKFNMSIDTSNDVFKPESNIQANLKFEPFPPAVKELRKRTTPNIRIELGGHGKFTSSGMIKITNKK